VTWGAVVVAAGSGIRFGGAVPKQFLRVGGRTLVDRSLDCIAGIPGLTQVVVVLPADNGSSETSWKPPAWVKVAVGGARRQDSVLAGLRALEGVDMVLVHDAARPFTPAEVVMRVMAGAEETGAAVPVIPVRDTVKTAGPDGMVSGTLPREGLVLSQTPQGFRLGDLVEALSVAGDVTDECLAMERAGHRVKMVEGAPENMKITDPADLPMAGRLACGITETRWGTGLDFHPFEEGRPLILGGLRLAESGGLAGHSDGDALLHAVADAILAAARMGDIGVHFPPSDPSLAGADSAGLLRESVRMVRDGGWTIEQIDVTVIALRPCIARLRPDLIDSVASILAVDAGTVWIKGTTTNTLGDIGAGKGLGCMVLAVINRPVPPAELRL
jgi:2-C-methyl-D-erythritol 4-phosphate cytidylyltransferase / 2-C-methyl-D-erythritol 2,4-cyclodiphosphate synthase